LRGIAPRGRKNNDGRWFAGSIKDTQSRGPLLIRFPVFPAVSCIRFVVAAGSALMFRDALFVVVLAGLGPALLFSRSSDFVSTAETRAPSAKIWCSRRSSHSATLYFFTAVQGTVWFAAHVVAVGLTGGYLLARFPPRASQHALIAGVLVGCGVQPRPPFLFCLPLFLCEAVRVSLTREPLRSGSIFIRAADLARVVQRKAALLPTRAVRRTRVLALFVNLAINKSRFGDPYEFGHTLLNVLGWSA